MHRKPIIGLILLRANWFESVVSLPGLVIEIQKDTANIRLQLAKNLDINHIWEISSLESLEQSLPGIKDAEVDLFVLSFQVWAEDYYLQPLMRAIGKCPLAVWCFLPLAKPPMPASFIQVLRSSGPVGTFEGLGTMHNLGVDYFFTLGPAEDPVVQADLLHFGLAAAAWRDFQTARFGLLPGRNEQMQSTFVDEFRLLADIGPSVQPLSITDLANRAQNVDETEVSAFVNQLRSEYPIRNVSDEALNLAARGSLGLAHLAVDHHLHLLSFNDISPELHSTLGFRPCLYPGLLDDEGILVGLEGDLGAACAVFALDRLTGSPVFFVEFWYWDIGNNLIVGGHAGVQNPRIANTGQVSLDRDFEYAQSDLSAGAHYQFVARSGRVTLFQLRGTPTGWQAIVASGAAVETEPWLEGYPHAVIRLDVPVSEFVRRAAAVGTTQHFAMAYGDVLPELQALCKILKVPLEFIS
jgi:L-fucose isomerase-like protein